jgi:ATP-binding protein involved in chromosome partitioning
VGPDGVEPPAGALGICVMSMDLLLADDATPLTWDAPSQAEAHTWRGTMEANALREFLADTRWGALDLLLIDLPPGTDRLATIAGLVPGLSGTVIVTIASDVSRLVVGKSITVARQVGVPLLGLIENMAGMFPGPGGESLAMEAGVSFLGRVPFDPALAAAADGGEPYVAVAPESAAGRTLAAIAAHLADALPAHSA